MKKTQSIPPAPVLLSTSALESTKAVLGAPFRERTDEEKAYDEMLKAVITKDGHREPPLPDDVAKHGGKRLYTVTTIAASARFGGTRTPVVCSTFERAKEIVEGNEGDLFEYSYRLAVIEAVVADWLYGGLLDERYWYAWKGSPEEGGYVPIEQPERFIHLANIGGIG